MPRWLGLAPAHSRNCRAESLSQSILETSAPPNSANWNWSAQSGIQSGDASSATLARARSEEHTSELQSLTNLVCRLLLEKKNKLSKQIHILNYIAWM